MPIPGTTICLAITVAVPLVPVVGTLNVPVKPLNTVVELIPIPIWTTPVVPAISNLCENSTEIDSSGSPVNDVTELPAAPFDALIVATA